MCRHWSTAQERGARDRRTSSSRTDDRNRHCREKHSGRCTKNPAPGRWQTRRVGAGRAQRGAEGDFATSGGVTIPFQESLPLTLAMTWGEVAHPSAGFITEKKRLNAPSCPPWATAPQGAPGRGAGTGPLAQASAPAAESCVHRHTCEPGGESWACSRADSLSPPTPPPGALAGHSTRHVGNSPGPRAHTRHTLAQPLAGGDKGSRWRSSPGPWAMGLERVGPPPQGPSMAVSQAPAISPPSLFRNTLPAFGS